MNIQIDRPRLEALIQQRMASGQFDTIEDALVHALESAPASVARSSRFGKSLVDVCAQVKDLAGDLEFSRVPSTWRELDLS